MGAEPEGDAACWLERVCDECGGFLEEGVAHECRRPAAPAGSAAPDE